MRTTIPLAVAEPVDGAGRLLHEGDLVAQLALAADRLVAGLAADVERLAEVRVVTTDRRGALAAYDVAAEVLALHGARPKASVVEVPAFAQRGMAVRIDVLALHDPHRPGPARDLTDGASV